MQIEIKMDVDWVGRIEGRDDEINENVSELNAFFTLCLFKCIESVKNIADHAILC